MDTETNEPTPRKLYYVEGYFDQRTHYTAWIEADSKSEAEDVAEMIDQGEMRYMREVKGFIENDIECFSGDSHRVILVDPAQDHLVMPEEAKTIHAD
jgi:hypothetical protein